MKKNVLILILAMLCCMPVFAQKRSKKSAAKTPQPTVVSFVAASGEEFVLFFNGTRINKEPQNKVEVTADVAKVGATYNVRAVIKKPRVGSDMAFATFTIQAVGEEYVVWANSKYDRAELLTRSAYNESRAAIQPKPSVPPMPKKLESGFKPVKFADSDTTLPDNVILIEKK